MAQTLDQTTLGRTAWYRQPMIWMVIAIPASAVLVGMVLLTLSIRYYDGLVVDDYYKQGLAINQTLERQRRAETLGIQASVSVLSGQGKIQVRLQGNDDFRHPPAISFSLHHAIRTDLDLTTPLAYTADGVYIGDFQAPMPGRWHLKIDTVDWKITDVIDWSADTSTITLDSNPR